MKGLLRDIVYGLYRLLGGQGVGFLATPKPTGTIDIYEASSIILDKLEEMGDTQSGLYLPDLLIKVYKKEDVIDYLMLDEIDEIPYIAEEMDCDDFSALLYGKFAGLIWTNVHALNWFIDDSKTLWFIEPQSDKIARNLESWQGWESQFLLGR